MANHIASISSSSRANRQHEALETSQRNAPGEEEEAAEPNPAPAADHEDSARLAELAKMSVMSLSDDDYDISVSSRTSKGPAGRRDKRPSGSSLAPVSVRPDLLSSKLGRLESIEDIDANFDSPDLHHERILSRIEQKWLDIANNLDATMKHLQDCSQQVAESSSNCLEALLESVGTTCDNVDDEVKAFYHLMTKCDELTTKLSIATSFRDEIKTLRKSIETLEHLYKNRPQRTATTRPARSGPARTS